MFLVFVITLFETISTSNHLNVIFHSLNTFHKDVDAFSRFFFLSFFLLFFLFEDFLFYIMYNLGTKLNWFLVANI